MRLKSSGGLGLVGGGGDPDVPVVGERLLATVDAAVLGEVLDDEERSDAVAGEVGHDLSHVLGLVQFFLLSSSQLTQ